MGGVTPYRSCKSCRWSHYPLWQRIVLWGDEDFRLCRHPSALSRMRAVGGPHAGRLAFCDIERKVKWEFMGYAGCGPAGELWEPRR